MNPKPQTHSPLIFTQETSRETANLFTKETLYFIMASLRTLLLATSIFVTTATLVAGSLTGTARGMVEDTPPSPKTPDPWVVATRAPALAGVYETIAGKIRGATPATKEAVAAEKHVAVRLESLHRNDPTNAFPLYLMGLVSARVGDWESAAACLKAGNAAPRVIYPVSSEVLKQEYGAALALQDMARAAANPQSAVHTTDKELVALLTEIRTMGNRLARLGEPRNPVLLIAGGRCRLYAETGLAAAHERAGRTAEAITTRAKEAAVRAWFKEMVERYENETKDGGVSAPEVIAGPFGITLADLRNYLGGEPMTSEKAKKQYEAFNHELAIRERAMADRDLKTMPE